jgi:hypothetical protein
MLRGAFPGFAELLERISELEQQRNAIARSLSGAALWGGA